MLSLTCSWPARAGAEALELRPAVKRPAEPAPGLIERPANFNAKLTQRIELPNLGGPIAGIGLASDGKRAALLVAVQLPEPEAPPEAKKPVEASGEKPAHRSRGGPRGAVRMLLLRTNEFTPTGDVERAERLQSDRDLPRWLAPREIDPGGDQPAMTHRGNDPQVSVLGDRIALAWTLPGDGPMGSGPLAVRTSIDGGATWRAARVPVPSEGGEGSARNASTAPAQTQPTKQTEGRGFRFPAIGVGAKKFHVVWIDAFGEQRRLGYSFSDGGAWTTPRAVDPLMCACCWNRIVVDGETLLAFYRDKRPSDMSLARSADGGATWTTRESIDRFDWWFEGCPHVGGAIALGKAAGGARPTRLFTTTWTGQTGSVGVYFRSSADLGDTWSEPIRVDTGGPGAPAGVGAARVADVAAIDDARICVVWDEVVEKSSMIVASQSRDGGATWTRPERLSGAGRATHPLATALPGGFLLAWTEAAEDGKLRAATAFVPAN